MTMLCRSGCLEPASGCSRHSPRRREISGIDHNAGEVLYYGSNARQHPKRERSKTERERSKTERERSKTGCPVSGVSQRLPGARGEREFHARAVGTDRIAP